MKPSPNPNENPVAILTAKMERVNLWEHTVSLARNEFLKVRGSADTNVYYILEGCLRIFVADNQEEHTIRFGYQHNLVAALDSFFTGQPSDLYMQALKKTEVKVISRRAFMEFIESDPEHLRLWVTILGYLVYQQLERERDILTASPQERYERVLRRSPQLFQEVPHKYIASYLRMTPETLSRMKKP